MARVKYLTVARGERLHIENYPNFHKSGSIKGMKEKYYGKDALLVRNLWQKINQQKKLRTI